MLFKKGERTVFAVRSFVLPKKYRPRPHFPLTETTVKLPPETTAKLRFKRDQRHGTEFPKGLVNKEATDCP